MTNTLPPNFSQLADQFKLKYPKFTSEWKKIVGKEFDEIYHDLKNKLPLEDLIGSKVKLKFVVDNNFVFGQIKGACEKEIDIKESFIFKVFEWPFVELIGPHMLKTELFDKIEHVLESDLQERATLYAKLLLTKISIQDAQWTESYKEAKRSIGHIDDDDVPYLALSIESNATGVISFDKVFDNLQNARKYTIEGLDSVYTQFKEDSPTMMLVGGSSMLLFKLVSTIAQMIFDLLKTIISTAIEIISKGAQVFLVIAIVGALLYLLFPQEFGELSKNLGSTLKDVSSYLKDILLHYWSMLRELIASTGVDGETVIEGIAFFLSEFKDAGDLIEKLNSYSKK